jgi:hypothetical protein
VHDGVQPVDESGGDSNDKEAIAFVTGADARSIGEAGLTAFVDSQPSLSRLFVRFATTSSSGSRRCWPSSVEPKGAPLPMITARARPLRQSQRGPLRRRPAETCRRHVFRRLGSVTFAVLSTGTCGCTWSLDIYTPQKGGLRGRLSNSAPRWVECEPEHHRHLRRAPLHAGNAAVADRTASLGLTIQRVFANGPGMGGVRHVDADTSEPSRSLISVLCAH